MKPQRRYLLFHQSFQNPLYTARRVWKDRSSLILREDDEHGNVTFGEVAPLPGHLDENLIKAEKDAKKWIACDDADEQFEYLLPAIQSIKSSIWADNFTMPAIAGSAKLWGLHGYASSGVIKRKVGLLPQNEEIPLILDWLNKLPPSVQVRLDPNESFTRDDLLRWTDALQKTSSIQFIEQPTGEKDDEWLIDYSLTSPIPLALDEALLRLNSKDEFLQIPVHLFLVIKPTLFGDWDILFELFSDDQRKIIFSTVFESPFGYEALIRLCSNSSFIPGIERSCFLGNSLEFAEHHVTALPNPAVSNLQLARFWDSLM